MGGWVVGWMVVVVRSCPQPPLTEAPRLLQRAIEEKKGPCSRHCLFGRLVILLSCKALVFLSDPGNQECLRMSMYLLI